ncbi:MAG: PD-(D/E)XK nuclease family protein [Gammaproteobacteria bacterium]
MPPNGRPSPELAVAQAEELLARGCSLLTATRRLARQIRQNHDQARADSGELAWLSADALPLDAWLRRTWEWLVVHNDPLAHSQLPKGRLLTGRLLTEDECRMVWDRVLADAADLPHAALIAPLAAAGWRLCQLWGITAADLHMSADTDDARAFAGWVSAYNNVLAERNWIDSTTLLTVLPTVLDDSGSMAGIIAGQEIGMAGFVPWTPAVDALAAALERHDVTVRTVAPTPCDSSSRIVLARDDVDELARAFRWAAELKKQRPGATVAIVLGNLELQAAEARRVGMNVLAPGWQLREPAARPVALAAGRQLTDYPVVATALAQLRLFTATSSFEEASHLLRSPYITGAVTERSARAAAELKLREYPLEPISVIALLPVLRERAPVIGQRWATTSAMVDVVRDRRLLPNTWAGHFSDWLAAAGWPGDRSLDSVEHQAAEAWQMLLSSFAAMDEVAGQISLRAALGVLARQAHDRAFEPESAAGAVQVLSLKEAGGQSFDGLWIAGLTADRWPAPARPHPLVPLRLQRAAGIPEAAAGTQESLLRQRLAQLTAAAGEVILSWPAERDGVTQLPSPFLNDKTIVGAVSDERDVEPIGDSHPLRDAIAAQNTASEAIVETVADDPPPLHSNTDANTGDQAYGHATFKVSGGSRVLVLQAVCPARAFIEFRLNGQELRAPARPLDPATRGRILHRLLEKMYRLEACRSGLGKLDTEELHQHYVKVVAKVLDEFLPPGNLFCAQLRPLEIERLWTQLQALRELDASRPDFQVETEVRREIDVGTLGLSLRLDRIDHLDEGGDLVIDYKTGEFKPAGWKKGRLQDSQLPLYALSENARGVAVVQILPLGAKLVGVGDPALSVPGVKHAQDFFKAEQLDWPAVLARWQRQLHELAAEFSAGDFRVNPADRTHATGQFVSMTRIFEFTTGNDESGILVEEGE